MKKELLYILFILLIFFAIQGFPTDPKLLLGDSTFDLNIHDTYLVISSMHYFIFTFLLLFSMLYFLRVVFLKFRKRVANYIYLTANGLFICSLLFVIQFIYEISQLFKNDTINDNTALNTFLYITIALLLLSVSLEIVVALKVKNQKADASTI